MSVLQEIENWTSRIQENFDIIIISYDSQFIGNVINHLQSSNKISRIILTPSYRDENLNNYQEFKTNSSKEIISITEYSINPYRCIMIVDFKGKFTITSKNIDYFKYIDRGLLYRKYCISILMYRIPSLPPQNGYWCLDESEFHKIDINNINPESSYILKLSDWGKLCQGISSNQNIETPGLDDILSPRTEKWINSVKNHLRYILRKIINPDFSNSYSNLLEFNTSNEESKDDRKRGGFSEEELDDYIDRMLDDENFPKWIKSFTHDSINEVYNYQTLETLGDKLSSCKFTEYMLTKYNHLTDVEATEFHNQYMSAEHQQYLSDDLRLMDFILIDKRILGNYTKKNKFTKTKTDLLESFVGALYETSLNCGEYCFAQMCCHNLFFMIGEQFPFEKKMIYGLEKHNITQILQSLELLNDANEIRVESRAINHGKADAKTILSLSATDVLKNNIKSFSEKNNINLSSIFMDAYEYEPYLLKKEDAEKEFWRVISSTFTRLGVDINFSKTSKGNTFIEKLKNFNTILYNELLVKIKNILSTNYPNISDQDIASRINFKSKKPTGELPYITMYINTYEIKSNRKILSTFVDFRNDLHTAGSDYNGEESVVQYKNLINMPIPKEGIWIGQLFLNSYDHAKFLCCQEYVTSA